MRLDVDLGALELMLQFPRTWPATSGSDPLKDALQRFLAIDA
jgi:hypothetical protein